jgi:hypothetical protein
MLAPAKSAPAATPIKNVRFIAFSRCLDLPFDMPFAVGNWGTRALRRMFLLVTMSCKKLIRLTAVHIENIELSTHRGSRDAGTIDARMRFQHVP